MEERAPYDFQKQIFVGEVHKGQEAFAKLSEQLQRTSQTNLPVAHIHAQAIYHDSAFIVANKKGLLAIKDAIERALQDGRAIITLIPADGEGYNLYVKLDDSDWQGDTWQTAAMPYTDAVAQMCAKNEGHTHWPSEGE